ncbi:MAG: hypothetical protein HYX69_16115 [Planctomycetia bacterium]|nr:hypothetical protein [Planctomycetia bacterium]
MTALRWIASSSASALHAAAALLREQPLVDGNLAAALASPVSGLREVLIDEAVPVEGFLGHAVPLSAGIENYRELAALVVKKVAWRDAGERISSRLAAAIADIEASFRQAVPDCLEQLELRFPPLREQWEARGPGLLAAMGRLTDAELLVEQADIVLVHPAQGGGGEAHMPYNSVSFEAVLANPQSRLPEVVRLGWLLSTLNLDLPKHSELVPSARLPWLAKMAMVPPALAAAEHVELAAGDEASLRLALTAWRLAMPERPDAADTLAAWWRTCQESPTSWPVALAALDRMLEESRQQAGSDAQ